MPAITIEACAIVSADGMLAAADHVMPQSLKFEADQRFFNDTLDRCDLIVHGRNSYEDQPNSPKRRRLILTHRVEALAPSPDYPKGTLWNPAGASSPQSPSATRSPLTDSFACKSSSANSARWRRPPSATVRSPSRASTGPSTRNSMPTPPPTLPAPPAPGSRMLSGACRAHVSVRRNALSARTAAHAHRSQ